MAFRPLVLSTVSILALGLAGTAQAQSAVSAASSAPAAAPPSTSTADEDREIIVSGVRASLATAQNIKRTSVNIVDSIVAEDIGKLPDNTVSDALQRVTGVQITRAAGEAASVQIRGLPNVGTLINGRESFTGTSRAVALADIPAELVAGVDVYKTSTPDLVEGGVAGMVDVRLHRPFDFKGLTVAGSMRGIYSDQADKMSYVGSGLVSDRWDTSIGEVGLLVSASYNRRKYQDQDAFDFDSSCVTDGPNCSTAAPYVNSAGQSMAIPDTVGGYYADGDRQRIGVNVSLQWRPNPDVDVHADGVYTKYKNLYDNSFFIGIPKAGTVTSITPYSAYPSLGQTSTTTNAYTLSSMQAYLDQTDSYQGDIGAKWTHGHVVFSSEVTYNYSKLKDRNVIVDTGFNAPSLAVNYDQGGTPNINISGVNLTNPANYTLEDIFDNHSLATSWQVAWRNDLQYNFDGGFLKNFKFGTRYTRRSVNSQATTSTPISAVDYVTMSTLPSNAYIASPTNLVHGKLGVGQYLTMNPEYLLNNTASVLSAMGLSTADPAYDPANAFADQESTYAFYGQVEYGFNLGSMPVTGVGGLRVVNTVENLQGEGVSGRENYLNLLPNINAKLGITDKLFLRLAWGKAITRPEFSALNPLVSYSISGSTGNQSYYGTGSGGNPALQPIKTTDYDASLEYYANRSTSVTLAGFYRSMNGYIQTYAATEIIDGERYLISRPRNTGSGYLTGAELAYQQFFDFLPGAFSGMGVQLNGTYSDGMTTDPNTGGNERVVDVSHWSFNAVAMYEKYGVTARLAYNWRSSYVDSYNSGGSQASTIVVSPTGQLDFSASYDVNRWMTLTFNATNLTNRVYHDSFEGVNTVGVYSKTPRDTRTYDQTFEFGARFKL